MRHSMSLRDHGGETQKGQTPASIAGAPCLTLKRVRRGRCFAATE